MSAPCRAEVALRHRAGGSLTRTRRRTSHDRVDMRKRPTIRQSIRRMAASVEVGQACRAHLANYDFEAMAGCVPDELVDEIAIACTPDEFPERLAQWRDITPELAGKVDEVVVLFYGTTAKQHDRVAGKGGEERFEVMKDFVRCAVASGMDTVCEFVAAPRFKPEPVRELAKSLGAQYDIRMYRS